MTWIKDAAHSGGGDPLARVFSLRPNLHAAWRDFVGVFWEKRLVDPVLLELCRLRIAQMNGSTYCLSVRTPQARAAGLEEKIARLDSWWQADPAFDATERACLALAEQFVVDAKGIMDEQMRAVVAALGDAGTVALVEAFALCDGFSRFCSILGIAPDEAVGDA
jgi:AhpD family alkylhydroperoxidase